MLFRSWIGVSPSLLCQCNGSSHILFIHKKTDVLSFRAPASRNAAFRLSAIFFHPDYDCRLRNCTESTLRLVGCTTGRDLHPALKMFSIDFIIEYYNASLSSLSSLPLHPVRPDHIAPGCSSHRFAIRQENGRTLSRIVLDAVFPGFLLQTELCIDVFLPKEYDMERKRERNPIKMKHQIGRAHV